MTTHDENKLAGQASLLIQMLGDLRAFILTYDLTSERKSVIRSAIKKVDELVGQGALDLPAHPATVFKLMENLSAARAGVNPGAYSNMLSSMRKAFALAKPSLANPRSRFPLQGRWRELQDQLDVGGQPSTLRLFHFAVRQGWQPGDITDEHIGLFAAYLRDEALVQSWESNLRNTI